MSDINNKNILIINLRKDCVIRMCKEWPLAYETEAQKEKRSKKEKQKTVVVVNVYYVPPI